MGKDFEERDVIHIKELANISGISIKEIHFFEEIGLIHSIGGEGKKRTRLFYFETVAKVIWIKKCLELGFSWAEIRKIMESWQECVSYPEKERLQEPLEKNLKRIEEEMKQLEKLKGNIQELLKKLNNSEGVKQFLLSVIDKSDNNLKSP